VVPQIHGRLGLKREVAVVAAVKEMEVMNPNVGGGRAEKARMQVRISITGA
jgi:hypothetical protein